MEKIKIEKKDLFALIVVSLGYFVDMYDIMLFSAVRKTSLEAIGVSKDAVASVGLDLLNWQMFGMLLGGLIFGILADKKGRLSMLYFSIILYSIANIANGFVTSINQYAVLRFLAGVGLAGELGVGVTLVSENLPKNWRTYATMIISSIGLLGGALAATVAAKVRWDYSYFIGGGMGLILLVLRYNVKESYLFQNIKNSLVTKGSLVLLFSRKIYIKKYLLCILSGAPMYIYTGIFITLAPEFATKLGIKGISVSEAIIYYLLSFSIADILGSLLSRILKSRKKALLIFSLFQIIAVIFYLFVPPSDSSGFYLRCVLLGIGLGCWGVLVTNAAEQFGTNLRATVTTSVANFVRGLSIPATLLFKGFSISFGIINSGALVSAIFILISILSIIMLKDNFENNMEYINEQ